MSFAPCELSHHHVRIIRTRYIVCLAFHTFTVFLFLDKNPCVKVNKICVSRWVLVLNSMQTRDRRFGTLSCGASSSGCSVPPCKQPSNEYVAQGHSRQPAGEFGLSIFTQWHKSFFFLACTWTLKLLLLLYSGTSQLRCHVKTKEFLLILWWF